MPDAANSEPLHALATPAKAADAPFYLSSGPRFGRSANDVRLDRRRPFRRALLCAFFLHAGLLAALLPTRTFEDRVGAAGTDLEAISIEVTPVSAGAVAGLAGAIPGAPAVAAPVAVDAPAPDRPMEPVRPEVTAVEPATDQAAEIAAARERPTATPPRDPELTRDPAVERPPPLARASPPATPGSAAADPVPATNPTTNVPAASPGVMRAYARSIVLALGVDRPKPAPGQPRGTVKLAFAVAEDGRIVGAHVAQSSGRPEIDAIALGALQRAKLPPAPPGMTPTERRYEIPYHFR